MAETPRRASARVYALRLSRLPIRRIYEFRETHSKIQALTGMASAFAADYAPEKMSEVATKLYKMSR